MSLRPFWPLLALVACKGGAPKAGGEAPPAVEAEVLATMNPQVDPCGDFYEYACGGWLASYELPADKSRFTRSFSAIHERNQALLREVIETAAANPGDDPDLARLGAAYGACTDDTAKDAAGLAPVQPTLDRIAAVTDAPGLWRLWGELSLLGVTGPFDVEIFGDFVDPKLNIAHMGQDGLGLPDRDYYLDEKPEAKELLAAYEAHVAATLALAGASEADAKAQAATIVAFETAIARIHDPRDALRDPSVIYNRIEAAGAKERLKQGHFDAWLAGLGQPELSALNVYSPAYLERVDALLASTSVEDLKLWTRWQALAAFAPHLHQPMRDASFAFYGTRLRGQKEQEPLWKRCVTFTQGSLGDVLAKAYVDRAFPGDSKDIALKMIVDIEHAFEDGLDELAWMDDATRTRAREKVATVQNKIGYPDAWRDYAALQLAPGAHFANVVATRRFEADFQLGKVGKPVDPNEWFMSASEVNAYYNPLANEMAFPAGILQPPFFDRDFPAAMNYGAIGMVMGHELTHGFDDSGAKFDPQGKMSDWWAPEATARFEQATQCVEKQYNSFEVQPGLFVNGKLTLGENIADLGGIKETHAAWKAQAANGGDDRGITGLTGEQLLFVAFAQGWCTEMTPELERERVATDSHSPARFRVNGPLANLPAFHEAFSCPVGSPMRPEETCEVW